MSTEGGATMVEPLYETPAVLRAAYLEAGYWSPTETLATLLEGSVARSPDADAVVDDRGRRMTYAELGDSSRRLAAALAARRVGAGDVIGMQLPNRAEASVVVCAAERLGAVVNPLVPMYRERELVHMARTCGTKVLVVPGVYGRHDFDRQALRVAEAVPSLELVVSLDSPRRPGLERFGDLLAEQHGPPPEAEPDPDAVTAVLFTSGTEAAPKGAIHTNNTLLATNRALAQLLDLGADDAIFMASPVGHATGFGFALRLAVFLGAKVVLQETWNPAAAARLMGDEACAYTHGSTPFAHDLLNVDGVEALDLSSLRYFVSGGASVPPGFAGLMQDRVGCPLLRLYGMSEAFMTTVNRPGDPPEILEERDGRAVPGVELQAWDDDGVPVPPGEPGQGLLRGPHRCLGFVDDPERTRATITPEGWLHTGDLVTIDAEGYATVVGRKKEVINRGGYKFSPREVENLLQLHPSIDRVAIVRMTDSRLGERACAFVVLRGAAALTLEDVVAYLRAQDIAPYKWPERLELVDDLPTTASGKVQKFVLEQRLACLNSAE